VELEPERAGRLLHLLHHDFKARVGRIYEKADDSRFGCEFAQQLKALWLKGDRQTADARDIAAGSVHGGDETLLDRIAAGLENDRYGGGCRLCCQAGRGRAACDDDGDLMARRSAASAGNRSY